MLSPGTVIGQYRLEERLDAGGKAHVWRSLDAIGHTVVVRIFPAPPPEQPEFTKRFVARVRAVARIVHRGVVDILDFGMDERAGVYLVMRYVEGDSLSRTLARVERLSPAYTMALVTQAADALHAAHEVGVVHGRLTPDHVMIRSNDTVVLTGFDVERSLWDTVSPAEPVVGDTELFSPEQALGEPATPLSDVFLMGQVAYQCLSGRTPFDGDNPQERAMRPVWEPAPALPPDIAADVRIVVERALAKDPGARWPSADAMAQAAREAAR